MNQNLSQKHLAKQDILTMKLNPQLKAVSEILQFAKKNNVSVPAAAKELGKGKNYVNSTMNYMHAAQTKNGITIPEIARMDKMRNDIRKNTERTTSPVKSNSTANTSTERPAIESTLAGLKYAIENKVTLAQASLAIGKSKSYLSMNVVSLDSLAKTPQQVEEVKNLHKQYRTMSDKSQIKKNYNRQPAQKYKPAPVKLTATPDNKSSKANNAIKNITKGFDKTLEKIADGSFDEIEYKYPLVANRPMPKKIMKMYALEIMKPNVHSFAVPATKTEMQKVKRAVTMFVKKSPAVKFNQKQIGNEFVTWRIK